MSRAAATVATDSACSSADVTTEPVRVRKRSPASPVQAPDEPARTTATSSASVVSRVAERPQAARGLPAFVGRAVDDQADHDSTPAIRSSNAWKTPSSVSA